MIAKQTKPSAAGMTVEELADEIVKCAERAAKSETPVPICLQDIFNRFDDGALLRGDAVTYDDELNLVHFVGISQFLADALNLLFGEPVRRIGYVECCYFAHLKGCSGHAQPRLPFAHAGLKGTYKELHYCPLLIAPFGAAVNVPRNPPAFIVDATDGSLTVEPVSEDDLAGRIADCDLVVRL